MSLPTSDEQAGNPSEIRLPQNPNRYQGPRDALRRIVLRRLVHEQRLSGHGPAVVAARRVRPERGHDQVARRRRRRARARGQGSQEHRHRAAAQWSGRHRRRAGLSRELAGPFSARVRQGRPDELVWEHELEANPEGVPAVYQVNGRQYIAFAVGASWGTGGDPVWKNPLHRKQGKDRSAGLSRVRLARK